MSALVRNGTGLIFAYFRKRFGNQLSIWRVRVCRTRGQTGKLQKFLSLDSFSVLLALMKSSRTLLEFSEAFVSLQ